MTIQVRMWCKSCLTISRRTPTEEAVVFITVKLKHAQIPALSPSSAGLGVWGVSYMYICVCTHSTTCTTCCHFVFRV